MNPSIEDLLRTLAPQVLGALIRRYGNFDLAEDAVQEGLLAAALQWPEKGIPENPRGWLIRVASRRLIDALRSETARKRREDKTAAMGSRDLTMTTAPDYIGPPREDDTLALLFLCCHPALTEASQIALTLRAVGGLNTTEIASAFLVPETTMAQRISRAKQKVITSAIGFEMPPPEERRERLGTVLHVLYLIFNEGYAASSGPHLQRAELAAEAIRLARVVHGLLPEDAEVTGLLALMLLNDARRPARTGPNGDLIPLEEQDRGLWDPALISEGVKLLESALGGGVIGPFQIQAAIAAVHIEAETADATDWVQIGGLYALLERITDNPIVTLNRAVAVAKAQDPRLGLAMLDRLESDGRMADHHRFHAVRAHLLEMEGDTAGAVATYRRAASRTRSVPEQRYLQSRAAALEGNPDPPT